MNDSVHPKLPRAFTLIELLLSMTLTACLMIAVSAAFNASADAVKFNDAYFRCTQSARMALTQITTEIRRADAVKVDPSNRVVQIIRPQEQRTADEIYRQYVYDPAGRRITLQVYFSGRDPSPRYEVAGDVAACMFGPAETKTDAGGVLTVIRVPLAITCSIDGTSVSLHGTAAPRRAQRFD